MKKFAYIVMGCVAIVIVGIGWAAFVDTLIPHNQNRLIELQRQQIEVQQRIINAQKDTIAAYERMLKK